MHRTTEPRGLFLRTALALAMLLPLAACGGASFAEDPFDDAASGCGEQQRVWRPGCATERNIAAQAENTRDLDTPRGEFPRDSMRRDAMLSGYIGSSARSEFRAAGQPVTTTSATGKAP